MKNQIKIFTAIVVVLFGVCSTSVRAAPVGLELSLAIDVSGSVNATEYNLQMDGYASAFRSAAVQNAILNSVGGSIALNVVQWSSAGRQQESIGWTLIDSVASANAFANVIDNLGRAFGGSTAVQNALRFSTNTFTNNGFDSNRQVIDISGDGSNNSGIGGTVGRDYALAQGIDTINGIVIGGSASVANYYTNNVIAGTNAFLVEAANFNDFASAIQGKLVREITVNPVPVPAAVWLFGTGIIGLLRFTRKQNVSVTV